MNPQTSQLFHADHLPLAVSVSCPQPAGVLQRWSRDNVDLIHALIAFDEAPRESRDDHSPYAAEFARLDAKLRLLLRLLARQVTANAHLPATTDLRLAAERLTWVGAAPGSTGEHAVAELYLSPLVPEPLRLHGALEESSTDDAGRTWQTLQFIGHSSTLTDVLTRYVFQQHRRAVAQSRQHP